MEFEQLEKAHRLARRGQDAKIAVGPGKHDPRGTDAEQLDTTVGEPTEQLDDAEVGAEVVGQLDEGLGQFDFARHAPGSDLFLRNPTHIEAAKSFYDAELVESHSVYVNLMTSIAEGGPAHTDNPRFHGRDRTNTPMWVLRSMLWSGLFDRYEILQATAIWWLNDVEGGGLHYWPNGPADPPAHHVGSMANTALFGDNHGMFHQVAPIGPLDSIRVSVLWKADVHRNSTSPAPTASTKRPRSWGCIRKPCRSVLRSAFAGA